MQECIIRYKDEANKCYCGLMRECNNCSTRNNRTEDNCIITIDEFCACRNCGKAVRYDGYFYKSIDNKS